MNQAAREPSNAAATNISTPAPLPSTAQLALADFPADDLSGVAGLLPRLREALLRQARSAPAAERARIVIVGGDAPLYHQLRSCRGWSCGYRNIQVGI
jgi:hypothetical protein